MPFADLPGLRLYYESRGAGTPLVLLSGTGETGDHWHVFQAPAFSQAHQVITFDYRGLGQSDKPDAPYSTRQFAADAAGLLEALGPHPRPLLGPSMGGRTWRARTSGPRPRPAPPGPTCSASAARSRRAPSRRCARTCGTSSPGSS